MKTQRFSSNSANALSSIYNNKLLLHVYPSPSSKNVSILSWFPQVPPNCEGIIILIELAKVFDYPMWPLSIQRIVSCQMKMH